MYYLSNTKLVLSAITIFLTILVYFYAILHFSYEEVPEVGKLAPQFLAVDIESNTHRLSDYKGNIVVLEWTSDECPYSNKRYVSGYIQGLQKTAIAKDVVWFTIVSSGKAMPGFMNNEEAKDFIQTRNSSASAMILDHSGKVGRRYHAMATPYVVVIDTEGMIAYMGAIDSGISPAWTKRRPRYYLQEALEGLQQGKKIDVPVTRAYGCMIKYS